MSTGNGPNMEPHIERYEWDGDTIEIHRPEVIFDVADKETITVLSKDDLDTPVVNAQISISTIQNMFNEPAYKLEGKIQLDKSRDDIPDVISYLKYCMESQLVAPEAKLRVGKTSHENAFTITDDETWVQTLINFQSVGDIVITNDFAFLPPDADAASMANVIAPPKTSINEVNYLRGFTQIILSTIKLCGGSIVDFEASEPEPKTYVLSGEPRRAMRSKTPRSVGSLAVRSDVKEKPPQPPAESLAGIEFSGKFTKFEDIGGLEAVKQKLLDIALSYEHPEIMDKWDTTRPQGLIFYGKPGTGKNMLVEALAYEIDARLWKIQATDIQKKWLGDSEANIKAIFTKARTAKEPTILFFDEFDLMINVTDSPRAGGADNARNGVAGIFKQEMNDLSKDNPNVMVILTTNRLEAIDESLIRSGRFNIPIHVPLPDTEAREHIFSTIIFKGMVKEVDAITLYSGEFNMSEFAKKTEGIGMSGADIAEILRDLRFSRAMHEVRTGQSKPITQQDILLAIDNFRKS